LQFPAFTCDEAKVVDYSQIARTGLEFAHFGVKKKVLTKFFVMKRNVHVLPRGDRWAVEKEKSQRASNLVDTQKEAIEIAKEYAKQDQSELVIHKKDGTIREKNSYGNDPYPPKG